MSDTTILDLSDPDVETRDLVVFRNRRTGQVDGGMVTYHGPGFVDVQSGGSFYHLTEGDFTVARVDKTILHTTPTES